MAGRIPEVSPFLGIASHLTAHWSPPGAVLESEQDRLIPKTPYPKEELSLASHKGLTFFPIRNTFL